VYQAIILAGPGVILTIIFGSVLIHSTFVSYHWSWSTCFMLVSTLACFMLPLETSHSHRQPYRLPS
jgi:hypothetical protein